MIVALIAAVGGHWAVLQTVAWSNMLADNLQTGSFTEALTKTFDGKHPCKLCNAISSGKKSEKKAEFPTLGKKLEFISNRPVFVFTAPREFSLQSETFCLLNGLGHRPPVPPPRSVAA